MRHLYVELLGPFVVPVTFARLSNIFPYLLNTNYTSNDLRAWQDSEHVFKHTLSCLKEHL